MSYASLLPDLCNVQRTVEIADGSGGFTSTESTVLRRLACRFNAMGERHLAVYADKLGTQAGFIVFMEGRHKILEGDTIIKIGDNRQFGVLLVKNYDEQGRFLTIVCRERDRSVE